MDYEEARIAAFRTRLFGEIEKRLSDGHKSYEGALTVKKHYANYFEHIRCESAPTYTVELHLYVFGPSRHYTWDGDTLAHALDLAESAVSGWLMDEFCDNFNTQDGGKR